MDEDLKYKIKQKWRMVSKRLLRVVIIIPFIVILILAASVYRVKVYDGTYEEGDWSNTQYGASQYAGNTSIGADGKITTNMTAQELWDKLLDEDGRVNLYLDGPEELKRLMDAEMVTQYLDTRSEDEIDQPIDWEKINNDVDSNEVQGIVKLKRALSDGNTITMTYKDPETFQTYIDNYNASGSESDRNTALKYFTIERSTVASTGTASPIEAGTTIYVPEGLGAVHTYMAWQMITSPSSMQYKLREQAGMNFDAEGFGKINGRYVIACTTTFGQVGDYIDFYKADGSIIPCIIGDIKNQNDAGCNEWGHLNGTCIVEFVVDKTTWYNPMHENPGTPNCHPEWNQYITKAVNGGSYFDNPSFGTEDIEANDANDEEEENEGESNGTPASSELYWPTDGTQITSNFGLRNSPTAGASSNHKGIDIGVPTGTNIYATEAGNVTMAGWSDSGGYMITIDHGNGYVTKYMHNSQLLVSAGETVTKGQVIAKAGSTGISTGSHLHFQIEFNGQPVDPLSFKYNNGMGSGTGGIGSNVSGAENATATYYAKVATWNEVTDTVESNDPDVESYSTTTYNMTTTRINYLDFVKAYTMPFDYLWDLLVTSEDRGFVLDLADLVHDSQIEITVHDNLSINTNVNTYTYTENEKIISRGVKISGTSEGTRVRVRNPAASEPHINSIDRSVVHTVITKTNTLEIDLTRANVWIVDYARNYTYQIPDKVVTQGGAGALEDIPYTSEPDHTTQTDDIGYGESQRQSAHSEWVQEYPDIVTTLEQVYCDYYYSTTNRNESIENTLERMMYVASPPTLLEKTNKYADEPNFVTILLDGDNRKAKHILLDNSAWLFDLLRRNDSTEEIFVDLTKYLFYKATGKDYGVTEFDFSIFAFSEVSGLSGGLGLLNVTTTNFTREEFIDAVQSFTEGVRRGSRTKDFRDNAGLIYDICVDNNINPVLCAAHAWQEEKWNAPSSSPFNYWGRKDYNGQNYENGFSSIEQAVQAYCDQVNSQKSGNLKSTYQATAEEFATVNDKFDGSMITIYDVFSAYRECSEDELEEKADYAAAYVETIMSCATQIFGEGALEVGFAGASSAYANADAYTKVAYLFPNGIPQNEAELMPYLTTINVPATSKSGNKFMIGVQVHKAIAQDVYNACYAAQQEGFRVYEIGGYGSWRWNDNAGKAGGLPHSQHCYGLAVDINSTENGQFKNGKPTGNWFYAPGSNPYSIQPNSALVQTFKAAGWGWGGDWTSSKDYMHFSFCGT